MWENGLIRKPKLISKCNTSQTVAKNSYNRHNAQYFKKGRQSDDEIWSVNRI